MSMHGIAGRGITTQLGCIADWLGVTTTTPTVTISGVGSDSRQLAPGMLFVALSGPRFDGHHYLPQAMAAGATAALVERLQPLPLPQLVVADPLTALGDLAAAWRHHCATPLVALTGSNGKTSVKSMLAAILAATGQPGIATPGNLNNLIGVPLTLLALTPEAAWGVIEMGANAPGEIATLSRYAVPQVALINNAAAAHLAGFGSLDGVAQAKGEIFGSLAADGIAIYPSDDAAAPYWQQLTRRHRRLRFGSSRAAEVQLAWQPLPAAAGSEVELTTPQGVIAFTLAQPGEHNVRNAAAAATAALALAVAPATIATALSEFSGVAGRLRPVVGRGGARLIDDSYNANPGSCRAAIAVLAAAPGRRIMVLGDMAELGSAALSLHHEVGVAARTAGIDQLFGYGPLSAAAVSGFGSGGTHFNEFVALQAACEPLLNSDSVLLIKGSRSMRMERLVTALQQEGSDATATG